MSIKIIDAHTHVQMIDAAQWPTLITRAHEIGVGMINAGADEISSRNALVLAHTYPYTWATVGYHPHEALKNLDFMTLETLAHDERVVGIGECGLDYFKLETTQKEIIIEAQKKLFRAHIELAQRVQKPLIIHCRDAFADVIAILQTYKEQLLSNAGIVHFFTGTYKDAEKLLELGFSFTFGGLITFNRSFDALIRALPQNNILVETDAPWVAPQSHRGTQNEPAYIPEIVSYLAQIKNVSEPELQNILLDNTKRIFRITV